MLDGDNKQNFYSLMRLRDLVVDGSRHLVIWVGAGASRWCYYPSWDELGGQLHSIFSRSKASYDRSLAATLIANSDFPKLFSLCKNADAALYHNCLASAFVPRPATPVYDNFLKLISSLRPMYVVTTNVDEALEQHISTATVVQRSDFQRCLPYLNQGRSFFCKLHGSVSAAEETVFTTKDYETLQNDPAYLGLLRHIFAESVVVFLGYGLKDEYVLRAMRELDPTLKLFGNGPHFIATASSTQRLPDNILPIQYLVGKNKDHRAAIEVLDIIIASKAGKLSRVPPNVSVLQPILKFRNTLEGVTLRREVLDQLRVNAGSEFIASVNAGLKRSLPFASLEKPRRAFATLVAKDLGNSRLTRAISCNPLYSDKSLWLWRKRSLNELRAVCAAKNIGAYDLCPCGSGEKLKFCCVEALAREG